VRERGTRSVQEGLLLSSLPLQLLYRQMNSHDTEFLEKDPDIGSYSPPTDGSSLEASDRPLWDHEVKQEEENDFKYRSCSWQKTASLLFAEYIVLAIMSFPWSYSVLGLVPGIIITVGMALMVYYTGLTLMEYVLRNPDLKDICEIGQHLFGSRVAWWLTLCGFLLNNTFIQGLHVLVGAEWLNTISNHATCTIVWAVIIAVVSAVLTLPRTLSGFTYFAIFSALTMFASVIMTMAFAGTQAHPDKYIDSQPVTWSCWPKKGTTYVEGMTAFLNIAFTFIGQVCYPSFMAEMKDPREFKKVLTAVTVCEILLYTITGCIMYVYIGNEYMTAPAYGSLTEPYKKIAFTFCVPTILFAGVLYSAVTSRMVFDKIFDKDSVHRTHNTVKGWATWIGVISTTWVIAFIIAEVIPFFSSLLSLMSSMFGAWFGFIFWGVAYLRMKKEGRGKEWFKILSPWEKFKVCINVCLIGIGLYIFGPGIYVTIQGIIDSYAAGTVGGVFTCADTGL
jgi:hypothetical protein